MDYWACQSNWIGGARRYITKNVLSSLFKKKNKKEVRPRWHVVISFGTPVQSLSPLTRSDECFYARWQQEQRQLALYIISVPLMEIKRSISSFVKLKNIEEKKKSALELAWHAAAAAGRLIIDSIAGTEEKRARSFA